MVFDRRAYVSRKLGAACVWRLSVTMTVARIEMRGFHAEVAEGEGDDVAGEPLSIAGDGVDGTRGELTEDGEAFDELGQLLEVLVEEAIEAGALGERHHEARFAGVVIAQVVKLRNVLVALAGDGGGGDGEQFVGGLPMVETTTTGRRASRARTMPATRSMAAALSTEVPPNFMTIISRASLPNASARHSGRQRRPRRGWCCG